MIDPTSYSEYVRLIRDRVGHLADEVWNAGRANRELFESLVSAEVDKATKLLGFAKAADVDGLRSESDELLSDLTAVRAELLILRAEIADLRAQVAASKPEAPAPKAPGRRPPARRTPVKETPVEQAPVDGPPVDLVPGPPTDPTEPGSVVD